MYWSRSLQTPAGHFLSTMWAMYSSLKYRRVEITGLASWLVPSYREYAVSCPDASIRAVLDGTENGLLLSVTSDDGLLNAIRTICDAGELTVTGSDGTVMEFGGENVKTILTLFGEILDALEVGA